MAMSNGTSENLPGDNPIKTLLGADDSMATSQPGQNNGSTQRAFWWIVSVLFVGFCATTAVVFTGLSSNIDRNRNDIATIVGNQQIYRERIVSLEAQAIANRDNINGIRGDLDYIKKRVDTLVYGQTGRRPDIP